MKGGRGLKVQGPSPRSNLKAAQGLGWREEKGEKPPLLSLPMQKPEPDVGGTSPGAGNLKFLLAAPTAHHLPEAASCTCLFV